MCVFEWCICVVYVHILGLNMSMHEHRDKRISCVLIYHTLPYSIETRELNVDHTGAHVHTHRHMYTHIPPPPQKVTKVSSYVSLESLSISYKLAGDSV